MLGGEEEATIRDLGEVVAMREVIKGVAITAEEATTIGMEAVGTTEAEVLTMVAAAVDPKMESVEYDNFKNTTKLILYRCGGQVKEMFVAVKSKKCYCKSISIWKPCFKL